MKRPFDWIFDEAVIVTKNDGVTEVVDVAVVDVTVVGVVVIVGVVVVVAQANKLSLKRTRK